MPILINVRKPPSEHRVTVDVLEMIKHFEGYVPYAYDDKEPKYPKTRITLANAHLVKGRLTIGYGRAVGVKPGDTCTHQEAEFWLMEDVEKHAQIVRDKVKVPLTASEFNALTDITYNLGYIPKSMLACLNGGVTDKGVKMEPGSYGSALREFPRNCRWGGIPTEELYRRRLADSCMFSDLPWENACSKNVVKLVHANGQIDAYASTSLEDTLLAARRDVPIQKPNLSDVIKAPWPAAVEAPAAPRTHITDDLQLSPLKPEVIIAPKLPTFEEELILDQPAVSDSGPDANGAELVRPDLPDVQAPKAEENTNSTGVLVGSPESTALDPTAPQPSKVQTPASTLQVDLPKSPPPIIAGTEGAKPIHPQSKIPDGIPYGIDPAAGAKPMEATERFVGSAMMWIANILRVSTANGLRLTGPAGMIAVFLLDMMKTPATAALVCAGIVSAIFAVGWFFGFALEKTGLKKKKKGEAAASQLMY